MVNITLTCLIAFTAEGRKIGIYILPGFDYAAAESVSKAIQAVPAMAKFVAPGTGHTASSSGQTVTAEFTFENSRSTYYDAVIFVGGGSDEYAKSLKNG